MFLPFSPGSKQRTRAVLAISQCSLEVTLRCEPQWPMMHLVMRGITRDQFMARHKANHIQVVYAPSEADARRALFAKAAAMNELGINVAFCGKI